MKSSSLKKSAVFQLNDQWGGAVVNTATNLRVP